MKLFGDNTAKTTHEEDGPEWDIQLTYEYNEEEKETRMEPGCPAYVEITYIERMELVNIDMWMWTEWDGATDKIIAGWTEELHEAINIQAKEAYESANEPD